MIISLTSRDVFDAIYSAFPSSSNGIHKHWPNGQWEITIEFNGMRSSLSNSEVFQALYKYINAKTQRNSTNGVHFCKLTGEWWFEVETS